MTPEQIAYAFVVLALVTILISFFHEVQKSKDKVCRDEGHQWEAIDVDEPSIHYRCKRCGRYA